MMLSVSQVRDVFRESESEPDIFKFPSSFPAYEALVKVGENLKMSISSVDLLTTLC